MRLRHFYRYIALAASIVTLFISISYIEISAQTTSNSNICLVTVETGTGQGRFSVAGQGKFSVAGQGRFSVAGQEGPDGALNAGDGNLTQDEVDEILNNVIDSSWLIDTVLKYPELGEQRVAILVVDDFADRTLTLQDIYELDSFAAAEVEEYYKDTGGLDPTTEITSVPHGETVMEVIETLIIDAENAALEQGYSNLNIDAFPVDISVNGEYRLDLLTSALQQAISYYREIGYSNIVVNMSFGFIPCTDNSFGPTFDFQRFLETRYNEIIFNVDGGTDIEGQTAPTFYSDFGMQQYFVNFLDIPFDNSGQYLAYLFNNIGDDTDDEGLNQFNTLIKNLLAEAQSSGGEFSFLPIASSGNYRDFYIANSVDPEPLAPARFSEIFAASATLGMDGRGWEYSQDGSMRLPGAWWHFGDGSYRAGTSYAAPYLSVIGALYLTSDNPPACNFSNGLPIAGDKMLWNNSHFLQGRLLCKVNPASPGEPTPTPTQTPTSEPTATQTPTSEPTATQTPTSEPTPVVTITELITNGGFEEFENRTAPIGWRVVKPSKDKVVCNKDKDGDGILDKIFAHTGDCAWRFKGVPGERARLIQRIDMAPYTLNAGDGFRLVIFADSKIVPRTVAKIKVQYADNEKSVEKFRIPETVGYEQFAKNLILDRGDVDFVKIIFVNKTPTKRLHIDDVSLKLAQRAGLRAALPLPEVPANMRD